MTRSIYITSAEGNSGKSTIALGMLDTLSQETKKVGVFRPIARSTEEPDYVLELLLSHPAVNQDYAESIGVTYEQVHEDSEQALVHIIERYHELAKDNDAIIIVGSDYSEVSAPTELSYNAKIAANLGALVLLVLGGRKDTSASGRGLVQAEGRSADEMANLAEVALAELQQEHATLLGVVVNRAEDSELQDIIVAVENVPELQGSPVWAIPEDKFLIAPTVKSVMESLHGEFFRGDKELLNREALAVVVAGMSMENVLTRLIEGAVILIPGDRTEVLLAVLLAHVSETFPSISGIVLYGGFEMSPQISLLVDGLDPTLPIIKTQMGTYDTVLSVTQTRGRLAHESQRKYDTAISLFERHVDAKKILELLDLRRSGAVTPLMFEHDLLKRARQDKKHIVLPEGNDDRILRAASTLLQRNVVQLTILGEPFEVRARAIELGLNIADAEIISPHDAVLVEQFAAEYQRIREHKGMTLERARGIVQDPSYFGTMMVQLGLADGMVSGAVHTTAETIKPSFEVIKTKPGVSVVSSVFLMALANQVLVYGDCAVIPDPTAEQLADIAISSAGTASRFEIDPRIAMLSYSTGESGTGSEVEKVREATNLVRARAPELMVEGPLQYDAAADAAVAAQKMPDSQVAGKATVFIFPDLNTGNNTYKAVQRSAGAVAIGPILQGLKKPINDLSRGALVRDIVNTVAITAIQAQDIET